MKELPIGTEIKLPFTTLKVEECDDDTILSCSNCFFLDVCEENGKLYMKLLGLVMLLKEKIKPMLYLKR